MPPSGAGSLEHLEYERGVRDSRGSGWSPESREKFRESVGGLVEGIAGNGIRGFLNSLVGTPIAVGFISGLVALGGDPVMAALTARAQPSQ